MEKNNQLLIVVALVIGMGLVIGLAFMFFRGDDTTETPPKGTSSENEASGAGDDLYNQVLAATTVTEFLAINNQSFDLECDDYIRYRQRLIQHYDDDPAAIENLVNDLDPPEAESVVVALDQLQTSFSELIEPIEAKAQACDYDDPTLVTLSENATKARQQTEVFSIANALSQYSLLEGALPRSWADIAPLLDEDLRRYQDSNINPLFSLTESVPDKAGVFPGYTALAETPAPGMVHHDGPQAADLIVIMLGTECMPDETGYLSFPAPGEPDSIAILYRLKSRDNISCTEPVLPVL